MFEHRLGLALGKTIGEIRNLPAPEYRSWQLFNLIEPWGFEDREYRTSIMLTMLHNVNSAKKYHKNPSVYRRDMYKLVSNELIKQKRSEEERLKFESELQEMTPEQRREAYMKQIQNVFGSSVINKSKK